MLSPASSFHLYGKGIFTTIAIFDGTAFRWDSHWARIENNADRIGLDLSSFSEKTVLNELHSEISQARGWDIGRARITLADGSSTEIWPAEGSSTTQLFILVGKPRAEIDRWRLTVSQFPINSHSPLAGVKSCNYLENILALDDAKRREFHEAIRLNERGEVTSACMANIFWLKDEVLFTPSLATGCLAGTTREYILENIDCREVEAGIEDLNKAEAIFLTSAGLGIVEAAELEDKKMKRSEHAILDLWPPVF